VPQYPDPLRRGGTEGEVVATFVVDTLGRADTTSLRILKSTHRLFSIAVREALPKMRFIPAELNGKKVRQQMEHPFVFALR
jgi:periplasmic protein TonB